MIIFEKHLSYDFSPPGQHRLFGQEVEQEQWMCWIFEANVGNSFGYGNTPEEAYDYAMLEHKRPQLQYVRNRNIPIQRLTSTENKNILDQFD